MRRLIIILFALQISALSGCLAYNSTQGWHVDTNTMIDNMFGWIPDNRSPEQRSRDEMQAWIEEGDREDFFKKRCEQEMLDSIPKHP